MNWGVLRAVRDRIEANCLARGILYPWWVPIIGFLGQVVCVLLALDQRGALWPLDPLLLTLPLVLAAPVAQLGFRIWVPWWVDCLGAFAATGWLLSVAPTYDTLGPVDAAPGLLAFAVAEATARDGLRPGLVVSGVAYAILGVVALGPGIVGLAVYAIFLEVGFIVGAMLLWQMRELVAERQQREATWQQATTAERERIAREIHDLVAHSLSVTLLHITGARHALSDVQSGAASADDAVGEADAALADAEQVGRRAMADIRRTVSSMADGPATRQSLPGAADIAALVREVDQAGLRVEYDERGDLSQLADATGLGLYRIAQESLANVAKHAPGSTARVSLSVGRGSARLTIRNRLAGARGSRADARTDGLGSGLAGMHARAAQLGASLEAGEDGDEWRVDVRLGQRSLELPCGHSIPGLGRLPEVPSGAVS
ncbi:histidine kinase [Nocardioides silvaticus]|uniref:histidine kinase n=1 Tax=Nocardioides silvaticus TaxID=2201891 RepID=A0A316TGK2_9ACTN|nr:histidine kinase [Nocardioides silvaticus]PWN02621.1 histidine kinase [Nocardioides silvaticus]